MSGNNSAGEMKVKDNLSTVNSRAVEQKKNKQKKTRNNKTKTKEQRQDTLTYVDNTDTKRNKTKK